MKHIFEIGSNLLCFEPDETKEKLIYHARVISHNGFEYRGKTKVALYLVHFLGWSKKWDRIVSESLLLPLTEFNRNLKAKIDFIAKNEKRHQLRHDLIDEVLEAASKVTNEEKFDWNEMEKRLEKISQQFKNEKKTESIGKEPLVKEETETVTNKSIIDHNNNLDSNNNNLSIENSQLQKENDYVHVTFSPKIFLSEQQLNLLSIDKSINSKLIYPHVSSPDDLLKQAWNPCVTDILQNYVDAFPVSDCKIPGWKEFERFYEIDQEGFIDRIESFPAAILDLSFDFNERSSSSKKQFKLPQWPDSELSGDYQRSDLSGQLCFEVCSGLRILFDFYARHLLLYENEIRHYESVEKIIEAADQQKYSTKFMPEEVGFKLLPEEYRNHRFGFKPSLFYGFPHLLRLFYKLPTILIRLGLTRCSLAVVLRHCYSLIKFLDISFTGTTSINYRQLEVVKPNQSKTKRKGSPRLEMMVSNEPRILLRRLVLSTDLTESSSSTHSSEMPRVIVTRSVSQIKK